MTVKKKKKAKKEKQIEKSGQVKLLNKIKNSGAKVVIEPEGVEKMSDVLQDFAEPLLDGCESDEEVKNTIKFTILVWNASLISDNNKQNEVIEMLSNKLSISDSPEDIASVRDSIKMMIERKKEHFSDIKRNIIDVQFSGSGANLRLDVMSSL